MGIQFTEDEERTFLTTMHTGIITTVRKDGWPISLPVWFVLVDGAIYTRTPARSKKVARVRNDDRACFLVEAGDAWKELHAVVWLGRLREADDEALLERVRAQFATKYAASTTARAQLPDATREHYGNRDVIFELRPDERRLTWDNRKLRMG